MRPLVSIGLALLVCATITGCQVGEDFQRPSSASYVEWLPQQGEQAVSRPVSAPIDARWWEVFHDPLLSSLIDRATASNLDLRMAAMRLEQSRAAYRVTAGERLPKVDGQLGYQRKRNSAKGLNDPSGEQGRAPFEQWDTGVTASWELDMWGRVRRQNEAAGAQVEMAEHDRRAAQLALQAEVARQYLALRGVQNSLAVTRENLALARNSLKLSQVRLQDGVATDLDVAEAAAEVSGMESRLPVLEQRQAQLINALGLLLAQAPRALQNELQKPVQMAAVPVQIPVGLPSELAERRPDIRRAEARLHAATASVGVAKADFYPRITLSGNVGLQTLQLSDLGSWGARQFAFGPQLSLPIFEGGRLRGQLQMREAQEQEAALAYQQTVLRAWQEIDDGMSLYNASQLQQRKLQEAVNHNQAALQTARRQYVAGAADFLNVLSVQRALLSTQQQWVESSTTQAQALVALYTALGGGW
ncbi:efflux transporter outer membrane subunit [Pseudomonas sp. DTU_2021_1001937_2_SI_NGA_ILE_001]|uniref:efflux transporter outer membrane subunit n=1 Tax=Pseudomonas sp. DTU_2021_1001937_2_SI_NGA_ILE_001 TaxID=3077589 RepID=UPI0028FC146A|nr:efflux transporter outer membrane subunit [Pseudomonas sp. DTU_2021_1001937_2_SI_NGA_ILE_001]WNW10647.1 efflux transporter outer membrane subunit [Pseudomonas sp. DTU_2021_1001937_2_SI_NGA_ILE_001]